MTEAADIKETLLDMADERKARHLLRFFKTGPGEYGEGDVFIGLTNPQVRLVVKECWRDTPLAEAVMLIRSELHEVRLCGLLILVEKYLKAMKKGDKTMMDNIFTAYISLHRHVNNWDLVDLSAIKIIGNHEWLNPDIRLMDEWIEPEGHSMWQQRMSMVSTWILTRHGRVDECFNRAAILAASPHDLLHKAAGWMLREAWKKGYEERTREFLGENVGRMSSVMLSYACERMTADERHHWQTLRKSNYGKKGD